jgi:hypothetical protein
MTSGEGISDIHADLLDLRVASLKVIALLTGSVGYVWLLKPGHTRHGLCGLRVAGWLCSRL